MSGSKKGRKISEAGRRRMREGGRKRWKGGRRVLTNGYVMLWAPGHPNATASGYVAEHRLTVELVIRRVLRRSAPVHHVNEDRGDNRNQNLVACDSQGYHHLLHQRLRALHACGNPNAIRCRECGGYENQSDIHVSTQGGYHRSCVNARYLRSPRHLRTKAAG